ncbi:unnamed protein product, partial [Polarella glacialis]
EVAVRSHLGLDALRDRKAKEEEERRVKREAARAKRRTETTQQEAEDEQALIECETQAWEDSQTMERVKYEAALIVRIACRFGTAGVWTKLAEARARGSDIPMDPRKVYVLAHPDKCPMPEASDATAILNAQRPPEMTEARPRPAAKASAAHCEPPAAATSAETAETPPPRQVAQAAGGAEERRMDPEDQQELTLPELREKYRVQYTPEDTEEYWAECQPVARREAEPEPGAEKRKTRRF